MPEPPETNPLAVEPPTAIHNSATPNSTTLNSTTASSTTARSTAQTEIQLPPPVEQTPSTLWDDLVQGWEFVKFVWRISSRIRRGRDRLRFVIGLILWKPILPKQR